MQGGLAVASVFAAGLGGEIDELRATVGVGCRTMGCRRLQATAVIAYGVMVVVVVMRYCLHIVTSQRQSVEESSRR
jgi:hypothetical protein